MRLIDVSGVKSLSNYHSKENCVDVFQEKRMLNCSKLFEAVNCFKLSSNQFHFGKRHFDERLLKISSKLIKDSSITEESDL